MNPFIKLTGPDGDVFILRDSIHSICSAKNAGEKINSCIGAGGGDDFYNVFELPETILDILCPTPCDTPCPTRSSIACLPPDLLNTQAIDRMEKRGSHFFKALAQAARLADSVNLMKIKETWAKEWAAYSEPD